MASRLFTVDLDLGLNKARRFIFEDFSTNPTGTTGRVIYWTAGDSSANHLKVYNGTSWKTIAYTDDVPDISISLDAATGFNVTGSPAGASGTLTFEWDTVAVNTVLAGPGTGSTAAIPTFRALVDADIPVEIARVDDVNTSLEDYILLTEKGEPLGVAELNASGVVPAEQLDLGNYVTLDGTQTITGQKTFNEDILLEHKNLDPSYEYLVGSLNFYESGSFGAGTGGFGGIGLSAIMDNANISLNATTSGSSISINSNQDISITSYSGDVIITSDTGGEFLGSVTTNNQIATVGDISNLSTVYQPLDADLTAIAGLTGTAGILTTDGENGWSIDTNDYLVAADLPSTFVESLTNTDGNITFSTSTGAVTADLANDIDIAGSLTVQGDLTVNGSVTTLNTETLLVEDNIVTLNSNVTGIPSINSGIEVERGDYDNASVYWNETLNKWWISSPGEAATSGPPAHQIARKFVTTTTGTTHTITHNLNTSDVTVNCWLSGSQVEADVVVTDANTVTVTTNSSITDLKTVVVG